MIEIITVNRRVVRTPIGELMPAWDLPDEDIANVMTYIYNNWGNSGLEVRPADVQANRVKKN
jgi:mono/diheme cytochrome c family protein